MSAHCQVCGKETVTSFFARQVCNPKDNDCIAKFNTSFAVRLKSAKERIKKEDLENYILRIEKHF